MEHDEVLSFGYDSLILFKNPDFQIINESFNGEATISLKKFITYYFEKCIYDLMELFNMHVYETEYGQFNFIYYKDVTDKFIEHLNGDIARDQLIDFMINRYISNFNIKNVEMVLGKSKFLLVVNIDLNLLNDTDFYDYMKETIEIAIEEMKPTLKIEENFSKFGIEYNDSVTALQKDILEELFYISVFKIEYLTKSLIKTFEDKDIFSIGGNAKFSKINGGIISRDIREELISKEEEIKYYLDVTNYNIPNSA